MAWFIATVAATALLAHGKLQTRRELRSVALRTEARVTLIDAVLAATVLAGVGLNALTGCWRAGPLAGLAIVYYGVLEDREAFAHAASMS